MLPPISRSQVDASHFFHVKDGDNYPDLQGTVLDNVKAAQIEAVRFAGDLLKSNAEKFWSGQEWAMTVTDENALTQFVLMFTATSSPATAVPTRPD